MLAIHIHAKTSLIPNLIQVKSTIELANIFYFRDVIRIEIKIA